MWLDSLLCSEVSTALIFLLIVFFLARLGLVQLCSPQKQFHMKKVKLVASFNFSIAKHQKGLKDEASK